MNAAARKLRRQGPPRARLGAMRALVSLLFALAALATPLDASAVAHAPAAPTASQSVQSATNEKDRVAEDSPRAALSEFLELTRHQRYEQAGAWLEFARPLPAADKARLAFRLAALLHRHILLDLDLVSPLSVGSGADGLPAGVDELGRVPRAGGRAPDPVRLVRRADADGKAKWLFSRSTVEKIDGWYDELPDRWLRDHLNPWLLVPGPAGLLRWQWAAFPLGAFLAWLLGGVLGSLTRSLVRRSFRRLTAVPAGDLHTRLAGPLRLGWAVALGTVLLPRLALDRPAEQFVSGALRAVLLLSFFWALVRLVDVFVATVNVSPWGKAHPSGVALLPLISRSAKIALYVIAVVDAVSELGYPVASILAGLGIGGLALALAAQKTVENLFGAAAIGLDQPFRIGDFIKVDDLSGTVEALGLRSTSIRTLDRTLVTVPNAKLADMRIENFSERDRFRLSCVLALPLDTPAARVRAASAAVLEELRAHAGIAADIPVVGVRAIARDAYEIEVMAWFRAADYVAFVALRQEVLLKLVERVEATGARLALPMSELRLDGARVAGQGE